MHQLSRRGVVLAISLAVVPLGGCASTAPARALVVHRAWARTTPPGARDGVAYLQIESPIDDELVEVTVPATIASGVELHESMGSSDGSAMANMPAMATTGGQMTMVALDRVPLPAHQRVTFEPGGKHLMLKRLAAPLLAGSIFEITLRFAHTASTSTRVEVRDNPP